MGTSNSTKKHPSTDSTDDEESPLSDPREVQFLRQISKGALAHFRSLKEGDKKKLLHDIASGNTIHVLGEDAGEEKLPNNPGSSKSLHPIHQEETDGGGIGKLTSLAERFTKISEERKRESEPIDIGKNPKKHKTFRSRKTAPDYDSED